MKVRELLAHNGTKNIGAIIHRTQRDDHIMDMQGIEPWASRMLSGCDTTTPHARYFRMSSSVSKYFARPPCTPPPRKETTEVVVDSIHQKCQTLVDSIDQNFETVIASMDQNLETVVGSIHQNLEKVAHFSGFKNKTLGLAWV